MIVTLVRITKAKEIGRVKKMLKDPLDISSVWRMAVSPMGANMKAISSGAEANSNFNIKKPIKPKGGRKSKANPFKKKRKH